MSTAFISTSTSTAQPLAGMLPIAENESMPASLSQLFDNDRFYINFTQLLNISAENLTFLLKSVQQDTELLQQKQQVAVVTQTPMAVLATLTICYAFIFIAGVLGNLITCIVISRNNFMHTATNFYLFNLAISDLILLLSGMPQDLYNLWHPDAYPFADTICAMESVLSETAANATVLTITAFTVERYIAICHPFRQHTMSKLSRAIKFIFAIWLTALLLALPQAMQFSVVPIEGGYSCTMNNDFYAHVFAVSGFVFFVGPMTAICVLYMLIGVKLKRSRLLQALPRRSFDLNRGVSAQTRIIRMLIAVAVAFFLCWAPFHAQRLMAVYGSTFGADSQIFNDTFNVLNYTSGVLYFLSTCINPLLYNIMSHKFRAAFKVTLARHFGLATSKYQNKGQQHNYSALLRHNGSVRLHTTDSTRTMTTTTTASNGGTGGTAGSTAGVAQGVGARRSLQRNRFSIGSQSTILTSLSKNDIYATSNASAPQGVSAGASLNNNHEAANSAHAPSHRLLQTQISQLSSVGDANSLLEMDATSNACTRLEPGKHTAMGDFELSETAQHTLPTSPYSTQCTDLQLRYMPRRSIPADETKIRNQSAPKVSNCRVHKPSAKVVTTTKFSDIKQKFRWTPPTKHQDPKRSLGGNTTLASPF